MADNLLYGAWDVEFQAGERLHPVAETFTCDGPECPKFAVRTAMQGGGATSGGRCECCKTISAALPDDYRARLETLHSAIYETGLSSASPDADPKIMIGSHTHSGVVTIQSVLDKPVNPTETPEQREKRIRKACYDLPPLSDNRSLLANIRHARAR
jgi:hypothetical protein